MHIRRGLIVVVLLVAGAGTDGKSDEPAAAELERLLWEAASAGPPQRGAVRAATALSRLWHDDADALCHITSVLARLGEIEGAASGERDQRALQSEA